MSLQSNMPTSSFERLHRSVRDPFAARQQSCHDMIVSAEPLPSCCHTFNHLTDRRFVCCRVRVQHAVTDANETLALSVASVFDVSVLPSKQIIGPQTNGQPSQQRRSRPQPEHAHVRLQDILSWLLRPLVLAGGSSVPRLGQKSTKRPMCACGLSSPTDTLRAVQYRIHTAAASMRAFASSVDSVGSVWGPLLRPYMHSQQLNLENTDDPWCWVSQNKVIQLRLPICK